MTPTGPSQGDSIPTISRFFGVKIQMHWNEHPPPHFHANYGGNRATFSIETLDLLEGTLPRRAQTFVLEWAMMHRPALGETGVDAKSTSHHS